MGLAVLTAIEAAVADKISHAMVSSMVREEPFKLVEHLEVNSVIAVELTRGDELRSSIAKYVI